MCMTECTDPEEVTSSSYSVGMAYICEVKFLSYSNGEHNSKLFSLDSLRLETAISSTFVSALLSEDDQNLILIVFSY